MSGTYMRDYAHMTPEEIAACIQAASEETERTPRAWRPSPMLVGIAATTASVMTLLAGAFYVGWLVYGQPDTGDPAIDDSAAYWGEIMSHSAYGVIGIFGGILGLVGVGACAWLDYRARRRWRETLIVLGQLVEPHGGSVPIAPRRIRSANPADFAQGYVAGVRDRFGRRSEPPKEDA